jgi:hypothetical protein
MGDFQGHPFRGNQWTENGAHSGGGSREGSTPSGTMLAAGGRSRMSRTLDALQSRRAELIGKTKTKDEWVAEATKQKAVAVEANKRVMAADVKAKDLEARMRAATASENETYQNASKACGAAYDRWNAIMGRREQMPDPDDARPGFYRAAVAALPPEARQAMEDYRNGQLATENARNAKWDADRRFRDANKAEYEAVYRERHQAEGEVRDANNASEVASKAAATYDRDAARDLQRTAREPRDPRETQATAVNAMDEDTLAKLDAAHTGRDPGPAMRGDMLRSEGNILHYGYIKDASGNYARDEKGQMRQAVVDKNGVEYHIQPSFKATIKDGSHFKKEMGKLYEGALITGLPRDADPHMLTIVHDEFRALRDEFPEVTVREIKLNAGGMRATAWSGDDKITFGKGGITSFERAHMAFASGKRRETPDENPDFHDGARSYASVVRHEFAHQVHFQHPELLTEFNNELVKESRASGGHAGSKITGYATKNEHERFAEAFALVKYGDKGTKAHPGVRAMDRAVKSYFGRIRAGRKVVKVGG